MRAALAATVGLVMLIAAAPALGQKRSIDVQMTAHLVSDYRGVSDYVDRVNDPECPVTAKGSTNVVADMTTVRPARFRVTRYSARGGTIYEFAKRHRPSDRDAYRAIDMKTVMTRTGEGGQQTPCSGYEPYPTDKCGTRSWALDGRPSIPSPGVLWITPHLPAHPSIEATMADTAWRQGGCGPDSLAADEFATSTDNERGEVKSPYSVPISVRRLFRPGRRTLRLRDRHTFTSGDPHKPGGGFTEVRTVEVTIRKLR